MILLPSIRSLARTAAGLRPHQRDLDRIVRDMRHRLACGRAIPGFTPPRFPPRTVLRHLRRLQLRKLRRTVAYLGEHVPYYRSGPGAVRLDARELRSLEDLRRLPITHRPDLQERRNEFISRAAGLSAILNMHTTGTTRRPLDLFLTRDELDYYASVQAISGMAAGFLGPTHILQVHLLLEISVSCRLFTAAAHRSGALVLNRGLSGTLDENLESIFRQRDIPGKVAKVSGLYAAPGYLWALTARAGELGLSGADSGLSRIFVSGSMVSDALRAKVREFWGLPLREAYSTVETVSTGAIECDRGRLHFLDVSGIIEFLDPETREPVPAGKPGVAVITTFYPDREFMPLLRYWTDDLMVPSSDTLCECGRVSTQIDGILGRADQMVNIGAFNIYPHAFGDVLTAFAELVQPPRFRVTIEERADMQHVVVDAEAARPLTGGSGGDLTRRILESLPSASNLYVTSGVVGHEVRLVPAGSIRDPFPYKLQGPVPARD